MGFFGMPRAGPPPTSATSQPRNPAPSSSSPASTTLRTPSSATGSAPLNNSVARQNGKVNGSSNRARGGSPLKKSMLPADGFSDDDLSPPPSLPAHASNAIASSSKMQPMDVDMEENNGVVVEIAADGSPIVTVSCISSHQSSIPEDEPAFVRSTPGSGLTV